MLIKLDGSPSWTRTSDPMINSHLLYQLSYRGSKGGVNDTFLNMPVKLLSTRSWYSVQTANQDRAC